MIVRKLAFLAQVSESVLAQTPKWSYTRRWGLTEGYEHVRLLTQSVLMPWRLLDRSSGKLIWKRRYFRPDSVCAVSEANGVIVACESRHESGGGCYALSLENGGLRWTAHGKGLWGKFLRLLDFVPFYANEWRDTPSHVDGNECFCESGRVLDLRTGRTLRRMPRSDNEDLLREMRRTDAGKLYFDGEVQVAADGRRIVNHSGNGQDYIETDWHQLHLSLLDANRTVLWNLDTKSLSYFIRGNYYSYRLQSPYVYLLVSEEAPWKPRSAMEPDLMTWNPAIYRLLTLDLWTGAILQNIRVSDTRIPGAQIEDVDERGLLVSVAGGTLHYYELMGSL